MMDFCFAVVDCILWIVIHVKGIIVDSRDLQMPNLLIYGLINELEVANIDLEIEPNKGNKSFSFLLFWQPFNMS